MGFDSPLEGSWQKKKGCKERLVSFLFLEKKNGFIVWVICVVQFMKYKPLHFTIQTSILEQHTDRSFLLFFGLLKRN